MNKYKFIGLLCIIVIAFLYGAGVGVYHWFPFNEIIKIKQFLIYEPPAKLRKIDLSFDNSETLKFTSFLEHREQLKNKLIVDKELIEINTYKKDKNSDYITLKLYGIKVTGILTKAKNSKKCLAIYIQGHGGDPFNFDYHKKIIKLFNKKGCDLLSLSMLGLGLNSGESSYPSKFGNVLLDKNQSSNHGNYVFYYDKSRADYDPLSLFLSPHYYLIKHINSKYEKTTILGISGGGWYTVWLAALIPEIDNSISFAGTLPFEYRKYAYNHGDWEQIYSNIYSYTSYWKLYKLMTIDNNSLETRQAILSYNSDDHCCYMDPYVHHFKREIEKLGWKNLNVLIDETGGTHAIKVKVLKEILKKIE